MMRSDTAATLARVARLYTRAADRGCWPTKAVADALGISSDTAAQRVRRARVAGYLAPVVRKGTHVLPTVRATVADMTHPHGMAAATLHPPTSTYCPPPWHTQGPPWWWWWWWWW